MIEYAGINYAGRTQTNVDKETGIRFAVISQNHQTLNSEAVQEVWEGENLSYKNYVAEFKAGLRTAMADYFTDFKYGDKQSKLDCAVENAFDAVSDYFSDCYQGDNETYRYAKDGYVIQNDETDLWILKSPFFTYAQFCSPCAPGACHLNHPLGGPYADNKCYCLGHDWFEDSKAPYPVYSVETGKLVN